VFDGNVSGVFGQISTQGVLDLIKNVRCDGDIDTLENGHVIEIEADEVELYHLPHMDASVHEAIQVGNMIMLII